MYHPVIMLAGVYSMGCRKSPGVTLGAQAAGTQALQEQPCIAVHAACGEATFERPLALGMASAGGSLGYIALRFTLGHSCVGSL